MNSLKKLIPRSLLNLRHKFTAMRATKYYGYPSKHLKVIGVTGTDGKTSTSTMLYEILKAAGKKVGLITTISAKVGEKEYPTGFHVTTPEPFELQKFLKEMVDEGMEYVVLETTSHSLDQCRVYGIEYHAAVFTNVTHEHLDYHKNYHNYLMTKAKLLDQLDKDGVAVLNHDDNSFEELEPIALDKAYKTLTYGLTEESDIFATDINEEVGKTEFTVNFRGEEFKLTLHLPGKYNVYNSLAAIGTALQMGISRQDVHDGLENVTGIEGRWEVLMKEPFKVVIDFAHTPNALLNVLKFAQEDNSKGRLIVVFGAAGQRDYKKRPLMGEAAGTYADLTILTAEDPRGESVEKINTEIAQGMEKFNKVKDKDYFSIPDRTEAIEFAIKNAKDGDTVIITGKGHEKSLNLDGKEELPWSDMAVAEKVVREILFDKKK